MAHQQETEPDDAITLGQIAFEAYRASRGGKNHDGTPTPGWGQLGEGVRAGWEAAAQAVRVALEAEPLVTVDGVAVRPRPIE